MSDAGIPQNVAIVTALNLIVQIIVKLNRKGLLSVQEGQEIIQSALESASTPQDRTQVKALLKDLFPSLPVS